MKTKTIQSNVILKDMACLKKAKRMQTKKNKNRYKIMEKTMFGMESICTVDGKPQIFNSRKEAQSELDEIFADMDYAVSLKQMERYSKNDFKIIEL